MENAADLVRKLARDFKAPDETVVKALSLDAEKRAVERTGSSRLEIQIKALEAGIVPVRYMRNIGTLGITGQVALLKAHVAVIGAGGTGCTVIELLSRAGIGGLTVVDQDSFSEDNLNRQGFVNENRLGRSKAEVAAEAVEYINSAVSVQVYRERLFAENAADLMVKADVIVDCVDNISSRFVIQEAAAEKNIPMVSAAIAGFGGFVTVIYPGDKGWNAIINKDEEDSNARTPEKGMEVQLGNLPATVHAAASLEAQEVIKIIAGQGETLRNKLLYFDGSGNNYLLNEIGQSGNDSR